MDKDKRIAHLEEEVRLLKQQLEICRVNLKENTCYERIDNNNLNQL